MFFYEGLSCPVCGQPFSEKEDIVSCPVCGAPHHRACWKEEGHCHFAAQHGTPQQWSRDEEEKKLHSQETVQQNTPDHATRPCPSCGYRNSVYAEFCSGCGHAIKAEEWQSSHTGTGQTAQDTSPFGGYREYRPFQATASPADMPADDTDLGDVTAGEMRHFLGQNASYYLPRFVSFFKTGARISWNWAAFLLAPYWLWFRKQYLAGALVTVFELIRTAVNAYVLYGYIGISAEQIPQNATTMKWFVVLLLLMFIEGLIHVFFALFGNYFYYRMARKRIKKLPSRESVDVIASAGGVSFGYGALAYTVLYLISILCGTFFMRF